MTTDALALVSAPVIAVLADDLDGWMANFYSATKAIARAVADGRISEEAIHEVHLSAPNQGGDECAALSDAAGFGDRDDVEAIGIAVDALVGLAAADAITGDEWAPGKAYTWHFDDAEQLTSHGITIDEFRSQAGALTVRQAAVVIVAAFDHLKGVR